MEIHEIRCSDAQDLLDNLRWGHQNWRDANFGEFAFRGQRDSRWKLIPSAFRSEVQLGYEKPITGPKSKIEDQSEAELASIMEFVRLADRVGLHVPGNTRLFQEDDNNSPVKGILKQGDWPHPNIIETLAIAQHHGVPTRLLDFTLDPLTAAFFAAWETMDRSNDLDKDSPQNSVPSFAIWAIDLRFIRRAWHWSLASSERVKEITVSRASNPFLHAQHGLFLMDTRTYPTGADDIYPPLEIVICERADYWKGRAGFWSDSAPQEKLLPPVKKLETPIECARDVLVLLHRQGITLAHLMPSHDKVVQALELIRGLCPYQTE